MKSGYFSSIASELKLSERQVSSVSALIEEGATVPFIARYRKEATDSLDEVGIAAIRDRLDQLEKLDERREAILRSLEERGLLTGELGDGIRKAETLTAMEDIYLPFRPKRRTRATRARELGLEPLASRILLQAGDDPFDYAGAYIDIEKGVESVQAALKGAQDIIAEMLTEAPDARDALRNIFWKRGIYESRVLPGQEEEGAKFRDYFAWTEPVRDAPSHRVLAMRRGEQKGVLSLRIVIPEEEALPVITAGRLKNPLSPEGVLIVDALRDGFRRLLGPSIETETRLRSRESADDEAIRVFAMNLRKLLLAPPLGQRAVMAIDPGFRTGCKLVCLDRNGSLLHFTTIHPFRSEREKEEARGTIRKLAGEYGIEFIAVGNGTAGRETEAFLEQTGFPDSITVISVNESGASIYSASQVARDEFPDHDITVRGSVSIGRRLQDPLAELVKIDPRSIGVGQYQHDVNSRKLQQALDDTIESCVNLVGVEVNTASKELLSSVSGLSPATAANIVEWRNENGPFTSRSQLKKVKRLGPKAFEQSAGFLRIRDAKNPLDRSAVHPESYPVVRSMADFLGVRIEELTKSEKLRKSIDLHDFTDERVGLPTLRDIMLELEKPGRDPREVFQLFRFADVHELKDVKEEMILPGIVTNVTNFGAFVDIGVHQDGLVHISQIADRYVRDPAEIVSVGDRIRVRVLEVDEKRKRIALSMKGTKE